MESVNSWLEHYEATWLLVVLVAELVVSSITLSWVKKEFFYDKEKDDKRKKTKTTKKTTKGPTGETIEEVTETSEPMAERDVERRDGSDKR